MRYSGVMRTCCGSRLPAVNRISSAMLKRNRSRETTYANDDDSSSVRTTAGTVTYTELRKKCHMSDCCHASTKFANVRWCGRETYPYLSVSVFGRSAT